MNRRLVILIILSLFTIGLLLQVRRDLLYNRAKWGVIQKETTEWQEGVTKKMADRYTGTDAARDREATDLRLKELEKRLNVSPVNP